MAKGVTKVKGSFLEALSTRREIKIYTITDSDLDLLKITNIVATVFFTVSGFIAALLINIWREMGTYKLAAEQEAMTTLAIVLFVLLAICLVVSVSAFLVRFGKHRQIKNSEVVREI